MSLDVNQFKELIVVPVLRNLDLYSESAVNLIIGTAIIESDLKYLKQLHDGPAVSIMQIEPTTYHDIITRVVDKYSNLLNKIKVSCFVDSIPFDANWLIGNLNAAVAFARLKYYLDPEPLPKADDIQGLAEYYKRVYNTPNGSTAIEDAITIFKSVIFNFKEQRVKTANARMREKNRSC